MSRSINPGNKILDRKLVAGLCDTWRLDGLTIAFTNGCFDLLHPGHIHVITEAAGQADKLVLGLNSDESVRKLKGKGRPIQNEASRAIVIAALEAVDAVVIFNEETPLQLIKELKPNFIVKGGDYKADEIVGGEFVKKLGGEVIIVNILPGHSTTSLQEKASDS